MHLLNLLLAQDMIPRHFLRGARRDHICERDDLNGWLGSALDQDAIHLVIVLLVLGPVSIDAHATEHMTRQRAPNTQHYQD